MTSWMDAANLTMSFASLILMIIGLLIAIIIPVTGKNTRNFFILFFSVLFFYVLSNLATSFCLYFTSKPLASQICLFFESFFSSLLMPLLTMYLLSCLQKDWRHSKLLLAVSALWFLYFALLAVTQFTSFIYYISPDNVYHRGPLYPLLLLPPVLIMAFNLYVLIRRCRLLSRKQFIAFLFYFLMPMAAMLLQMLFYGVTLTVIGTTIAALFMLIYILTYQVELYVRQKDEIARQRESIMVLQMRPHFIYNTLVSIYYLCGEDTQKAQQVILDFTSYLRKNFTAIAKEGTIPFTEELEHTHAYLAVEQVRFEGKLFVRFHTPHTMFRLPPLTLQPIVENAVKHGIDPERGPLHISISTQETPGGSEILVEDDGLGYLPPSDDEPHIALSNIRERLSTMCRGRLEIKSRPEGGTCVRIVIPKGKKPQKPPRRNRKALES